MNAGADHPADCTCRAHPLPASLRVRAARDCYLAENGFTAEAYDSKWTPASLLGIPFAVPNTRVHRRAIMLHDLHHVATGYGTDLIGEGEVSAWEARGGLFSMGLYIASLISTGLAAGCLLAPRRTARAARTSAGRNLLGDRVGRYQPLLEMTVGELRALLGIPARGVAVAPRGLHSRAPRAGSQREAQLR